MAITIGAPAKNISSPVTPPAVWSLDRLVALAVIAGFAFLFIDVRYEHRSTLGEHPTAWIPILFAGGAVLVGVLTVALWHRGGRWAFALLSLFALLIGFIGVWHHTDGNPFAVFQVLQTVPGSTAVAEQPESRGESEEEEAAEGTAGPVETTARGVGETAPAGETEGEAPLLAPLAFTGLGLFGLLASMGAAHGRPANRASA